MSSAVKEQKAIDDAVSKKEGVEVVLDQQTEQLKNMGRSQGMFPVKHREIEKNIKLQNQSLLRHETDRKMAEDALNNRRPAICKRASHLVHDLMLDELRITRRLLVPMTTSCRVLSIRKRC